MIINLNNKSIKIILMTLVFLMFLSQAVFTISVLAAEEDQNINGEANENTVYINASHLEYQEDKTILSGGIKIRKKETVINALQGELFRDERKMILEKEIDVEYPDGKVKSKLLTAFLEKEEYIFENEAVLNYTLSDGKKMVLESDYLKIFGEDNSFTAKENVEIDYDQQKFKGDNADYNGESEMLELTGNVRIEEDDDWISSDKATFNLQEGEEGYTAEGNVEIKMILD